MPLSSALPSLKSSITSALDSKVTDGSSDMGSDNVISNLAEKLSSAIDEFSLQALVTTTATIDPNLIETGAGKNATPVVGPGTGTISNLDVSSLESDIVNAYTKSTAAGSEAGAKSSDVISILADDLSKAILRYAKTALVTTEDTFPTFLTVGLVPPASPLPITPATMLAGEQADGTGKDGDSLGLTGLDEGPIDQLKSSVEESFIKSTSDGAAAGASSSSVNSDLGSSLGQSIHDFFISSVVKTEDTTRGGTDATPVPPSGGSTIVNPPPAAPTPTVPPPKTRPGAVGSGIGALS